MYIILAHSKTDLLDIAEKYLQVSPEKSIEYAKSALLLSQKYNLPNQQARALNTIANAYKLKNENENTLAFLKLKIDEIEFISQGKSSIIYFAYCTLSPELCALSFLVNFRLVSHMLKSV